MRICVSNFTIIGSDNGLVPGRCEAIIWNQCWNIVNAKPRNKFLSAIFSEIHTCSCNEMQLTISSAKRRQFCRGRNVVNWSRIQFFWAEINGLPEEDLHGLMLIADDNLATEIHRLGNRVTAAPPWDVWVLRSNGWVHVHLRKHGGVMTWECCPHYGRIPSSRANNVELSMMLASSNS